jgi:hypothetical protein
MLVKFETGWKRILHYVAQILDIDDDDDYEVKLLKRSNKGNNFILDTCHTSLVAQTNVVARLPQPSVVGAASYHHLNLLLICQLCLWLLHFTLCSNTAVFILEFFYINRGQHLKVFKSNQSKN